MFPRTISAPASSTARWVIALTVPWVPTGMNAGVWITPWGVVIVPVRAEPSDGPGDDLLAGLEAQADGVERRGELVSVGTTIAQIEQATKVLNAVHKRMHQAQAKEFGLLVNLFKRDPESLWRSNRNPQFRRDVAFPPTAIKRIERLLVTNPIDAWTGAKGTGGKQYFRFKDGRFASTFKVAANLRFSLESLTAEIVDLRIGQYLRRGGDHEPDTEAQPAKKKSLELWQDYMREEIAPLFGAVFSRGSWNSGMVTAGNNLILLMTLKKGNLVAGNEYEDSFVDPVTFRWHTQSQTTLQSKHVRIIRGDLPGHQIHLFVRPSKLRDKTAAPFTYCGPVSSLSWEGEKPITVTSKLSQDVPNHLRRAFRIGPLAPSSR